MSGLLLTTERSATTEVTVDVAAARRGDRAAYARLVDRFRNVVCSIGLATLGDVDASEEVAQQVFIAAWHGLHKLRSPESFAPWLRQLARNQARFFARGRRRTRRRLALVGDEALSHTPDPARLAPDELVHEEDRRRLSVAIDELPADAREVVTLYYREGRSIAQVASLLELREETVKKRLERARTRLRQTLLDEAGELLARTAPKAAFTLAVSAALVASAPTGSAAAAGSALAGAAASGGTSAVAKAGAALLAPLPAALVSAAGVGLWFIKPLRDARPGAERREIKRLALLAMAHPLFFTIVLAIVDQLPSRAAAAAILAAGWVTFVVSALVVVYLPFLRAGYFRRRDAEAAGDPGALARLRNERRLWIGAMVVGTVAGAVTLGRLVRDMLA